MRKVRQIASICSVLPWRYVAEISPTNAVFTHAGLTTRCRAKSLYSIFVLSKSRDILFIKRLESLLKIVGMKFEF